TWDPAGPLPVPDSLGALLRARLESVPADVRELLLVVAATSEPTVPLVERAVGDTAPASLAEAVRAGMVDLDAERIRFTHPLLGSVLLGDSAPGAIHSLHL